jgi:hypothetical protein
MVALAALGTGALKETVTALPCLLGSLPAYAACWVSPVP